MKVLLIGTCLLCCAQLVSAQEPLAKLDPRAAFETGDFEGAAEEFAARLEQHPDDAELAYNLALARWKSGDADGAETAAEKAAAMSKGRLRPLRDGLVGNLRFEAARAATESDLQHALELARQSKVCFAHGAASASREERAPLVRNLERALRLIAEIEKKIEEQQQQQQDQQQDQSSEDESKQDESQQEDSKDQQSKDEPSTDQKPEDPSSESESKDDQQSGQSNEDEKSQQGDPTDESEEQQQSQPEPQPGADEQESSEPRPSESEAGDEQEPPKDPSAAKESESQEQQAEQPTNPSEQPETRGRPRELSEEEAKRLLRRLQELEDQQARIREAYKRKRKPVERDW
ncbi:MAG: hypothetical protein KDB80_10145 [Planctomycetes bacterium]|nr:hypothetical protein [Planctomycetota bacterium]